MKKLSCADVQNRIAEIEAEIKITLASLKGLPSGKLICSRNGKNYKWYLKTAQNSQYLPKSRRKLAEKLAIKRYYEMQLEELSSELAACRYYVRKMEGIEGQAEQMLFHEEWGTLLARNFEIRDKNMREWANEAYEACAKYPQNLIYRGTQGKMLRSKSEVIIDALLYRYRIPFRYECGLLFPDGSVIYPDFTIMHPRTGRIIYWEHLGMMDDEDYRSMFYEKMKKYSANGIFPNVNLILTCETGESPLDIELVEKIIGTFLAECL